jgi:hypothetical protein
MKFLVFFSTPEERDACMTALQKDNIEVLFTGNLAHANLSQPPAAPMPVLIILGDQMVVTTCMQYGANGAVNL